MRNSISEVVNTKTKDELNKEKFKNLDSEFSKFYLENNTINNFNENCSNKREIKNEINFTQKDFKYIYGTALNNNNFPDGKSDIDKRKENFKYLNDDIKQIKDEIDYLEKYTKNTKDEIRKYLDSS